jgi:hypothetical protein
MAEIVLDTVEIAGLWSLQGNRTNPLADLVNSLFATDAQLGKPLQSARLCLLPLWPHQAYLQSRQAITPTLPGKLESLLTDIAHGYCQFRLHGEQSFDFVASYLSTDIAALRDTATCRRCRLGQYTVILWWGDQQDIHFLLERSYAQSFADHIDSLIARWRPQGS